MLRAPPASSVESAVTESGSNFGGLAQRITYGRKTSKKLSEFKDTRLSKV